MRSPGKGSASGQKPAMHLKEEHSRQDSRDTQAHVPLLHPVQMLKMKFTICALPLAFPWFLPMVEKPIHSDNHELLKAQKSTHPFFAKFPITSPEDCPWTQTPFFFFPCTSNPVSTFSCKILEKLIVVLTFPPIFLYKHSLSYSFTQELEKFLHLSARKLFPMEEEF